MEYEEDDVDSREPRPPYDAAILEPIRRDVGLDAADVAEVADHMWQFCDSEPELVQHVVDELQQTKHDMFTDTTWPACPHHPNHPMDYGDGWWRCPRDGPVVKLGELSRLRERAAPS